MNLYFDLFSGISGDMIVGSLINLGVDFKYLKSELAKLHIHDYELSYNHKIAGGISCGDFDVKISHSHHEHTEDLHEHTHHPHNNLSEITNLINSSSISDKSKKYAISIFNVLAVAEAKVHGCSVQDIHFHEVGAIDSIVDIVGAAICIDYLNVDNIYFGPLPRFFGEIKCQHGIIPLPGPAVVELTLGMEWEGESVKGELITPTGAAFLSALGKQTFNGFDIDSGSKNTKIVKVGYGTGKKDFGRPNYVRALLLDEVVSNNKIHNENINDVLDIEFNLDDFNPELHEELMNQLFTAGARDVMILNGLMKKGRMGILVKVLCDVDKLDVISNTIFENSTSIGLRYNVKNRICLERNIVEKDTKFGKIRFKETILDGKVINSKPEYEDCKEISKKINIPIKEIMNSL